MMMVMMMMIVILIDITRLYDTYLHIILIGETVLPEEYGTGT
jgi:hypothetical protein